MTIYEQSGEKLMVIPKVDQPQLTKILTNDSLIILTNKIHTKSGEIVIPQQRHCIKPLGNNLFKLGDCGYSGPRSVLRITKVE